MRHIPEVGDVVKLKTFAFNSALGGTGMSDGFLGDKKFDGVAEVSVTKAWHDYETGWRFHGQASSHDLIMYLMRNALPHSRVVYFGEEEVA